MRKILISLFMKAGLFSLWRYWNRSRITILALHGVAGQSDDAPWSPLWERPSPQELARVIDQLGKHYQFVSLNHAVQILEGSAPPVDNALVVTFDDGYRNNFLEALPVLAERGVPATFFVATGYVETGKPYWVDRLDYALQHAPEEGLLLRADDYVFDMRNLDRNVLGEQFRRLRVHLKKSESDDLGLERVVDKFATALEADADSTIYDVIDSDQFASVATWNEQRAVLSDSVTIGSHTVQHARLTAVSEGTVDEELASSKRTIEEHLNQQCEFFCYPNGDHNDLVSKRVAASGYRCAVTTKKGLNSHGDNLYSLNRYPMPFSKSEDTNRLLISGLLELPVVRAVVGAG